MATRSMPTVSWRSARNATLSLLPTPSVDETSTGSRNFGGILTKAAKAPMPPSTSGRDVARASGAIRRTASSPASMSTPATLYVSGSMRLLRLKQRELGTRLGPDPDLVVAGETRVTELSRGAARGLQHAFSRELAERVGADIAASVLDAMARSDQLLPRGCVDPVVAGPLDRRGRDPHVDLAGAGAPDHPHDLAARRSTHDGVVDDDHPPTFQHLAHRVELHLDPEVTDALLGLDERPANIVIADEAQLVTGPGLLRVTQRRARPRVGNRDDDVGLDRVLAGQLAPERLAHGVDVAAPQHGVGTREVHVLEHAVLALGRREGADRFRPRVGDGNDLARFYLTLELRLDEVERARLRCHDPGISEPAQAERPEPARITDGVHRIRREDHERIGPVDLCQRMRQLLLERAGRRPRQQVQDDLGIRVRLEDGTLALHLGAQGVGVREVAVVGDGDGAAGGVGRDRLGVPRLRSTGRRIPHVTDGAMPGQPSQALRAEHVGHPAHGLLDVELLAVGGRDTRGLLPAMLEGVETEVGDVGRFRMIPDAEHATFVVELVVTPRDVQSPSSTRAGARGDRRQQPWSQRARS